MKIYFKLLLPIAISCISVLSWAQESALKPPQSGSIVRAQAHSVAVVMDSPPVNTNHYDPSTNADEAATCKKNLEKISAAIEAYRTDNQDVPNWLSDMVPKYLSDTN